MRASATDSGSELVKYVSHPTVRIALSQAVAVPAESIAEKILRLDGFELEWLRPVVADPSPPFDIENLRLLYCKSCKNRFDYFRPNAPAYIRAMHPKFCRRCGSTLAIVKITEEYAKQRFPQTHKSQFLENRRVSLFIEELRQFAKSQSSEVTGRPDRGSVPDLLAKKGSDFYVIEIKSGKARLTPNQRKVAKIAEKHGIVFRVMRLKLGIQVLDARLDSLTGGR